jgi:hypothetical protein
LTITNLSYPFQAVVHFVDVEVLWEEVVSTVDPMVAEGHQLDNSSRMMASKTSKKFL